jgi:hypothetical protein
MNAISMASISRYSWSVRSGNSNVAFTSALLRSQVPARVHGSGRASGGAHHAMHVVRVKRRV